MKDTRFEGEKKRRSRLASAPIEEKIEALVELQRMAVAAIKQRRPLKRIERAW